MVLIFGEGMARDGNEENGNEGEREISSAKTLIAM